MNDRKARGQALATDKRIKLVGGATWFVPSESGQATGRVVDILAVSCSCPDFELHQLKCKHLWAVEFRIIADRAAAQVIDDAPASPTPVGLDNSPPTSADSPKRKTYAQKCWRDYNTSLQREADTVVRLLKSLCEWVESPLRHGRGRPPIRRCDLIFAMVMKVYTKTPARQFRGAIEAYARAGNIEKAFHHNSLLRGFESDELTPVLEKLIELSASPLLEIDRVVAIDSTGFTTAEYRRWFDAKYGREMCEHNWIKLHAICGTLTHAILEVSITPATVNDGTQLPPLVEKLGARMRVAEVSGDKAYLTHDNLNAIVGIGAKPYIPFKINSRAEGSDAWRAMWRLFALQKIEFLERYHRRSNVESCFSAVKRTLGASLSSKGFVAQKNELLCMVIAHNLRMLNQALVKFGVDPTFNNARAAS